MNNLVQTRSKIDSALPAGYLLPAMLCANTLALLALERLGGIADWIKTAAALFLAF